eukprot:CAMPEP_0198214820 /NCGR_PEP_ID=MMETSP1445-20131203/44326_1 /TAXON_ID=36898 /ORGANISM="Pyramimonas sp., Strain CCMP2087" /LENGTH=256 /DNA_ID=CAMNT_0043890173 /DNA_START=1008 /DNA_END=1779 /DNA_ORIENTATION=-
MSVPPQQEHLLRRPRLLISDVPLLDLPQLALLHHLLRELQHLPDGHPGEDLLKGGGDEHVVGGDERDVQHAALCDQPVVTEQDAEPPAFVFRFHGGQAVQQVVVAFDGGQGGRLHGDPGDGVFADPLQLQVLVDGDALEHHHVEARLDAPVGEEAKVAGAVESQNRIEAVVWPLAEHVCSITSRMRSRENGSLMRALEAEKNSRSRCGSMRYILPSTKLAVSNTAWPRCTMWSSSGTCISAGSVTIPPIHDEYNAK